MWETKKCGTRAKLPKGQKKSLH